MDGKAAVYQRISRYHCEFSLGEDGQPNVKDIGSRNGTYWAKDGRSIRLEKGGRPISSGELVFGYRDDALKMRVRSFGGAQGKGLWLTRADGPIHYVMLWDSFDLGLISSDYQGYVVAWDCERGIFLLVDRRGETWLLPGQRIVQTYLTPITVSKAWDK